MHKRRQMPRFVDGRGWYFRFFGLLVVASTLLGCGGNSDSRADESGFFLQVQSPFFAQEPRTFQAFSHDADGGNLAPQPIAFLENQNGNRLQYFDPLPKARRNFSIVETLRSETEDAIFVRISINTFVELPDGRYTFRSTNNVPTAACDARERSVAISNLPPRAEEVAAASAFGGRGGGDCCSENSPAQLIIEPIISCESLQAAPEQRAIFASAHPFNSFDNNFEPTSFQQARYGLATDINEDRGSPIPLGLDKPYSSRSFHLESKDEIQFVSAFARSSLGGLSLKTAPSDPDRSEFFDFAGETVELVAPWDAPLLSFQPFFNMDFAQGRSLLLRPKPMQAPVPMSQMISVPASPFDGLLVDANSFRHYGWTRTADATPGTALVQLFVSGRDTDSDGRQVEHFLTWNIAFDPEIFNRLSLPDLPVLEELLQISGSSIRAKLVQYAYADGRSFDQFWSRAPTVDLGGLAVKGVSLGSTAGGEREQDLNLESILNEEAVSEFSEFFPTQRRQESRH